MTNKTSTKKQGAPALVSLDMDFADDACTSGRELRDKPAVVIINPEACIESIAYVARSRLAFLERSLIACSQMDFTEAGVFDVQALMVTFARTAHECERLVGGINGRLAIQAVEGDV